MRYELDNSSTGLTRGEAAIMDLWDAGHSKEAIIRELGVRPLRVKNVINDFHDDGEQRRADAETAAACRALAAAIAQTGSHHA